MSNTYGANIESIDGKLILKDLVSLDDFNIKQVINIDKSHIQLDDIVTENQDFTIFIAFKHDNTKTESDFYIGLCNNVNPAFVAHFKRYLIMKNNEFLMKTTTYGLEYSETILSAYQNKQLFLWCCKQGTTYKAIICTGGHIDETIIPNQFQANRVVIHLPYLVLRVGFSENYYNIYEKEFHKICFLEKSNGTYFI